ncbi:MAG: DNA polymerase III subunit epsilon [Planctomycetota bacterium]|nr:MAG: DNA polymerase III subunit epsilon [Planctomycetota bacterium]
MNNTRSANSVVVLDFETTGLSPRLGDRAIEIGAVLLVDGKVIDQFQKLMNPGFPIDSFIENYTGITNKMLRNKPPCEEVMSEFVEFIGGHNLVAHNASFDKRFLDAELDYIDKSYSGNFACSMLIARRIYQESINHTLGEMVDYKCIPTDGVFHRALADSEMTAKLWLVMLDDIQCQYEFSKISFDLMKRISRQPKKKVHEFLQKQLEL